MKLRLAVRTLLLLVAPLSAPAQALSPQQIDEMTGKVQQSHIDANVPPKQDFDRLLRRDLTTYFGSEDKLGVRVEYELLRDGPTQIGVGPPKYFLWIRVVDRGAVVREGAARVAAMERKRFEVTHFLERDDIERDPSQLHLLFPPPVASEIEARIEHGGPP